MRWAAPRYAVLVAAALLVLGLAVVQPWLVVVAGAGFAFGWIGRALARRFFDRDGEPARRVMPRSLPVGGGLGLLAAVIGAVAAGLGIFPSDTGSPPTGLLVVSTQYALEATLDEDEELRLRERLSVDEASLASLYRAADLPADAPDASGEMTPEQAFLVDALTPLGWRDPERHAGGGLALQRPGRSAAANITRWRPWTRLELPVEEIELAAGVLRPGRGSFVELIGPEHAFAATTPPESTRHLDADGRERLRIDLGGDGFPVDEVTVKATSPLVRNEVAVWLLGLSIPKLVLALIGIVVAVLQDKLRALVASLVFAGRRPRPGSAPRPATPAG